MNKKIETKRFAVENTAGREITIVEFTTMTHYRPLSGEEQWIPGTRSYQTATGQPINPQDDGTYLNVVTDEILRVR
jgi:hypothetical protein